MTLSHYLLVELQLGLDILGGVGDADLDAPRDAPRNDPFQGLNNNKKNFNDYLPSSPRFSQFFILQYIA